MLSRTRLRHQSFEVSVDGPIPIALTLIHGSSMGDEPIAPCVIDRTTSPRRAGRMASLVASSSSTVHHRHAACSSCSRGSHRAVDGSNLSVRHAKKVSTEYRGWPRKFHSPWVLATGSPNAAGSTTVPVSSASSRGGVDERFAWLDPAARSDPERRLRVTRILNPEQQDASGPVDNDHPRRWPVERWGHHLIVTGREASCTAGAFTLPNGCRPPGIDLLLESTGIEAGASASSEQS